MNVNRSGSLFQSAIQVAQLNSPRIASLWGAFFVAALVTTVFPAKAETFTPEQVLSWEEKAFGSSTTYQHVYTKAGENEDNSLDANGSNSNSVYANSEASASGLFLEQRIDLLQTPYLTWRWRPEHFPDVADEKIKSGDDFALRVYVVAKLGWGPWKTKAISYVWSQNESKGTHWNNPFTGDKVVMLALRGEDSATGWQREKRNIRADFQRFFNVDLEGVDAIAIMTDADNSQSQSSGYYADLQLLSE